MIPRCLNCNSHLFLQLKKSAKLKFWSCAYCGKRFTSLKETKKLQQLHIIEY